MVSMNSVWDETTEFVRRESSLLVPLAAATLLIASTVATLAAPGLQSGTASPLNSLAVLAAALWSMLGQVAISLLVLRPGASVAETLSQGASRLPKVVLIGLLFGVVLTLAFLPFVYALIASGFNPAIPASIERVPAWATFYLFLLIVVIIWLYARLVTLLPLIADANPGVIAAIKSAFAMTRGLAPKLIGLLIVYVVVSTILGWAVQFVFGSIFMLVGRALDAPFVGAVLTAIVAGAVSAALTSVATVFAATLYRRLSSGT